MTKRKTLAPVNGLFDQGYKLSYFCKGLSKYVENQLKSDQTDYKVSKTLNKWFKKIFFILRCLYLFVRSVFSKFVIKNGIKERKL
ncbi:MAG: hypothetical protein BME94_06470, partial [Methanobacteriales archaeon Met13]